MEHGRKRPSLETLIALANVFNVSIEYLIGESDDETPVSFQGLFTRCFMQRLSMVNPSFAYDSIYKNTSLSFDNACVIAGKLNISLDYLAGFSDEQALR
jgi:DNA-binding XRE family transcriptional regulator